MVLSRFKRSIAAIRSLHKGKAVGDRPDLSRHAARIINEMAVATFVLDREGRVAIWNDACARLTGLDAAKVIGTKGHWKGFYLAARPCLADLALEGGAAKVGSLYAAQGEGGGSDRLQARNWCDLPRGARVYLAIDADVLRDSAGAVIGVVETLQDLTAVKEAEAAIAAERAQAAERLETVVAALGAGLAELAKGDLVARVETDLHGEADRLRLDFNAAAEALHSAMGAIVEIVATIRGGADQISSAIDELSTRTEGQATSLEQTASAVDQITGTVKKTAQVVGAAHKVVSAAKGDAERSGEIVRQAIAAMGGIEQSSKHIVRIIGVIDEIAFQTNLLALNAGVEAARAGDAGRGFAVVASEVRALAQRSAEAAKEIKSLISSSAKQVDLGVDLVGQTSKALERIVAQVVEIDHVVSAVAKSAEEQAGALQQVDRAVAQMDQSTQRNAEMAQRTTAAARALAAQTGELEGLTGRFGVTRSGARVNRIRARAARVAAE
jgi:methyl-accepting chemotaxis protein